MTDQRKSRALVSNWKTNAWIINKQTREFKTRPRCCDTSNQLTDEWHMAGGMSRSGDRRGPVTIPPPSLKKTSSRFFLLFFSRNFSLEFKWQFHRRSISSKFIIWAFFFSLLYRETTWSDFNELDRRNTNKKNNGHVKKRVNNSVFYLNYAWRQYVA